MNNYDFLKKVNIVEFVKRGVIPIHVMDYLLIYETYLSELKQNKKNVSIVYCSDKFNLSERTIRRIIDFMTN